MRQKENPFPGMNPYMESRWPGFHARLVAALDTAISEKLPEDLRCQPEERLAVIENDAGMVSRRADVAVTESWREGVPPVWSPEREKKDGGLLAEPEIILEEPTVERWLEIRTAGGRLITVIEVLSPSNKSGDGWHDYKRKQRDLLSAEVNLVELDLLRGGQHTVAVSSGSLRPADGSRGIICVKRAHHAREREVYYCPLRERLRAFRLPLREDDADLIIDLQPLVDNIHHTGRYWQVDAQPLPEPPLAPGEVEWVLEKLRIAGWEQCR